MKAPDSGSPSTNSLKERIVNSSLAEAAGHCLSNRKVGGTTVATEQKDRVVGAAAEW